MNSREEQIERFVNNEMTPQERQAFVELLAQDSELKAETRRYYLMIEAIRMKGEEEALHAMLGTTSQKKRKLSILPVRALLWGIATAAVLIGAIYFAFLPSNNSVEQIFSEYYTYPEIEHSRGNNNVVETLQTAIHQLKQKQPQAAIDLITPGTLQSDYEEEAQWILLGAYLQMNEKEKADSLATVIYRAEGVFSAQAEQIIHKLK